MPFCTNCGQQISGGVKFCPQCGTPVFESTQSSLNASHKPQAVQKLIEEIAKIDAARKRPEDFTAKMMVKQLVMGKQVDPADKAIANIIRNFQIPNTPDEVFSFLSLALSNLNATQPKSSDWAKEMQDLFTWNFSQKEKEVEKRSRQILFEAWASKAKQVYQSADAAFGDTPGFLKIDEIYYKVQREISNSK